MDSDVAARALGLDFGTTNTVAALADGAGGSQLIEFAGDQATGAVFRSALCFWEEESGWNGIAHEAGPWAIAEYLQSPLDSRFVQSFKTVAAFSYASDLTEPATILVAYFGGGTTDFSIVRVAEPGAPRRYVPLASSGVGIAGDQFDKDFYRINPENPGRLRDSDPLGHDRFWIGEIRLVATDGSFAGFYERLLDR